MMHRCILLATLLLGTVGPGAAQTRHAVLLGGLGGTPDYTATFRGYLADTYQALIQNAGFDDARVIVLAEAAIEGEPFVDGVATAEAIRAAFADLAARVGPEDDVYVLLFGHGSERGGQGLFNIPRRDLTDADYDALLDDLPARRVVFVNTASASGPFIEALSGPERVVVTATRRGTQRNETRFPQFFVEALTAEGADLDKNGSLTVREAFVYAARATDRWYEQQGLLATEHALLDDDGDGNGTRVDDLDGSSDGAMAAATVLRAGVGPAALAATPVLAAQKARLEEAIVGLIAQKSTLAEAAYYAELESLFVQLARLNDEIEGE